MRLNFLVCLLLLVYCGDAWKYGDKWNQDHYSNEIDQSSDDKIADNIIPVFSIAFFASLINGLFSSAISATTSAPIETTTTTTTTTTMITTTTPAPISQQELLQCANEALENINSIIAASESKKRKWKQRTVTCQDLVNQIEDLLATDPKSEEFCLKANIIKEMKVMKTCAGATLQKLKSLRDDLTRLIKEELGNFFLAVTINILLMHI